jgi:hypothetical protein
MSLLHAIGSPSPKLNNNYALICLSWIFARCPPEVQNKMIAALDSIPSAVSTRYSHRDHPLGSWSTASGGW